MRWNGDRSEAGDVRTPGDAAIDRFREYARVLAAAAAVAVAAGIVVAASARPPEPAELRNIAYWGICDNAVPLKDGVYEGEPFVPGGASRPRVEILDGLSVMQDLDGDGVEDAAVLLSATSGGSGVFTYLAFVSVRDGRAVNIGTAGLGDRVMIRSMAGREGAIVVELVKAGPAEALCCPTLKVRNTYRLAQGKRIVASSEEQGILSITDLEGVTWRLARIDRDEKVPEGVKVTAAFGDGKVSGSGGCNRYSAAVTATRPAGLSIGPAASTRMACPPPAGEFEDRFLSALQGVDRYGFLLGKLTLGYRQGDVPKTMIFERESPE